MRNGRKYWPRQAIHVLTVRVLVIKIPDVPHRRMAVVNVKRMCGGNDSLGWSRFRTNHQIVAAQIELLQRQRAQRQHMTVEAMASWHSLQERRGHAVRRKTSGRLFIRHQREQVRLREDFQQRGHHSFTPRIAEKPVMNDGNSQVLEGLLNVTYGCVERIHSVKL